MSNLKPEQKFLIEEDVEESYFSEFDYLTVRESYCMACDSPLKTYHSLICPECLNDGAELLNNLVHSYQDDDSNQIFINPEKYIDFDNIDELENEQIEAEDAGEMEDDEYYEDFDDEESSIEEDSNFDSDSENWINPVLKEIK